jgi:hypothetical protein
VKNGSNVNSLIINVIYEVLFYKEKIRDYDLNLKAYNDLEIKKNYKLC